jgi:hypothetical protein
LLQPYGTSSTLVVAATASPLDSCTSADAFFGSVQTSSHTIFFTAAVTVSGGACLHNTQPAGAELNSSMDLGSGPEPVLINRRKFSSRPTKVFFTPSSRSSKWRNLSCVVGKGQRAYQWPVPVCGGHYSAFQAGLLVQDESVLPLRALLLQRKREQQRPCSSRACGQRFSRRKFSARAYVLPHPARRWRRAGHRRPSCCG